MEFQTELQKQCYERVHLWIHEIFGEQAFDFPTRPSFGVPLGSAFVRVDVRAPNPELTTVTSRAYVVQGVEMTPDLMAFLLRENAETLPVGAFGVDRDGDIVLEHTVLGNTIDKDELRFSMMVTARIADDYDDKIVARWGGERALDRARRQD